MQWWRARPMSRTYACAAASRRRLLRRGAARRPRQVSRGARAAGASGPPAARTQPAPREPGQPVSTITWAPATRVPSQHPRRHEGVHYHQIEARSTKPRASTRACPRMYVPTHRAAAHLPLSSQSPAPPPSSPAGSAPFTATSAQPSVSPPGWPRTARQLPGSAASTNSPNEGNSCVSAGAPRAWHRGRKSQLGRLISQPQEEARALYLQAKTVVSIVRRAAASRPPPARHNVLGVSTSPHA